METEHSRFFCLIETGLPTVQVWQLEVQWMYVRVDCFSFGRLSAAIGWIVRNTKSRALQRRKTSLTKFKMTCGYVIFHPLNTLWPAKIENPIIYLCLELSPQEFVNPLMFSLITKTQFRGLDAFNQLTQLQKLFLMSSGKERSRCCSAGQIETDRASWELGYVVKPICVYVVRAHFPASQRWLRIGTAGWDVTPVAESEGLECVALDLAY